MGSSTPNLGLYKPDAGEVSWGDEVNANFDAIDSFSVAPPTGLFVSYAAGLSGGDRVSLPSGTGTAKIPMGSGNPLWNTNAVNKDPLGWASNSYTLDGADPTNAWGLTWVVGDAIMLPPGIYLSVIHIGTSSPMTTTYGSNGIPSVSISLYLDQAEFDPANGGAIDLDPPAGWWYERYFNSLVPGAHPPWVGAAASTFTHTYSYVSQVVVNDTSESKPFVAPLYVFNQPGPNYVNYWDIRVVKIA